ncbi:cell wall hydrolase [Paenibacillus wulumuqiensis]|uniref:cell wall hydrolase n=1 Tax=Paenibacillus wulumuqiensis TaxID=1567107 RepID=UPI0006199EBE|nr:cell wall hydrolase [Paenibacillus wulumuqiensis]
MDFIRRNQWITPLLGVLFIFVMSLPFWMDSKMTSQQSFTELPAWGAQPAGSVSHAQNVRTDTAFMTWNHNHTQKLIYQVKAEEAAALKAEQHKKKAAQLKANTATAKAKAMPAAVTASSSISDSTPTHLYFTRTKLLSQSNKSQATWTYALSDKEQLLLERIVMAEAEGEPYEGKVAVANVVLNRLRSANFPDTIKDVIYQRYQFSPVTNGRFERVTPNADSVKAVHEALEGRKEVPDNTYYFVSLSLATDFDIPNTRTKVEQIGHHTFYK